MSAFPIFGLSLIGWVLLRWRKLNPTLERLASASVVVGMLSGFIWWLLPDLPLPEKAILAFPMAMSLLIAVLWPESKGRIWPRELPSNRRMLWSQRFFLGSYTMLVYGTTYIIYGLVFPSLTGPLHSWLVPNSIALPVAIVFEGLALFGFLSLLRIHIRSLLPKRR